MSSEPASPAIDTSADERKAVPVPPELAADEMPCPVCGSPMPDLKGGKASICPTCGFKDSCCF
jgi:hypothetical protein